VKKILGMFLGLALVLVFAGCGGGGSDADVIKAQKQAMDDFSASMEKAGDGAQMAAAIDGFRETLEEIAPQAKALQEKYPGMKEGKDLPEDLQKEIEGLEASAMKMMGAMMKAAQSEDPQVQAAMQKLQEAMQKMQ